MSNKNLSQSITEAWKTAVETGQRLDENKQKREQEVSKIFDSARTDVIQHVLENDHGFYRPDVDPFFSAVDGGMLRRQRLTEQEAPMPPEAGPALDDETKERRKRYETAFEGPITGREQGKIDSEMEAIKKREEEGFNRRNQENIEREREERGEISQDRIDKAYTGSLTADGGDRAGRGREGLIRARGGNAQDIDIARRGDAARAEAEGRQRFKIGGGRGGYYYGDARITDNQGRTQAEREAEREAERAELESNTREMGLKRLKGLDQDRRERIERELGPDADLEALTGAISQERRNQDRVSGHRDSGLYDEGDYDPNTGRLTDSGRAKQDARRSEKQAKREKVRAAAKARNEKARDEADAARNERLARREARRSGKPYTRPGAGKYGTTTTTRVDRTTSPSGSEGPKMSPSDANAALNPTGTPPEEKVNPEGIQRSPENPGETQISVNSGERTLDGFRNYLNNLKLIQSRISGSPEGKGTGSGPQTANPNEGQVNPGQGAGTETAPGQSGTGQSTWTPGRRRPGQPGTSMPAV